MKNTNHDLAAVPSTALLDFPPSDGYKPTVYLRWMQSAVFGGTVLAQKYESSYVGEDAVWCVIPNQPHCTTCESGRKNGTLRCVFCKDFGMWRPRKSNPSHHAGIIGVEAAE